MKKIFLLIFSISMILIIWILEENKNQENFLSVVNKINTQDMTSKFWRDKTFYWIIDTQKRSSKCNHYTNKKILMYPSLDSCDNNKCPFILSGEYWLDTEESCLSFPNVDKVGKYFEYSDLSIYCDFIIINKSTHEKKSGVIIVNHPGICPVLYKSKIYLDSSEKDEQSLGIFLISSRQFSSYHIDFISMKSHKKNEKTSSGFKERDVFHSIPENIYPLFLISHCENSLCSFSIFNKKKEVRLKYFSPMLGEWNGHNLIPKCSFITIENSFEKDNKRQKLLPTTAFLRLTEEGVCPIEIITEPNKKDTVYVRSVKTDDGYKALITNKPK